MVIDSVKVKQLNGSRRPRPTTRLRDFLRLNKSWMNSINQKAAPWKESCKLLRICKRSLPPAFQRRAKVTPLKLEAKCKMSLMFYHLAREAKWLQQIGQNLIKKWFQNACEPWTTASGPASPRKQRAPIGSSSDACVRNRRMSFTSASRADPSIRHIPEPYMVTEYDTIRT